MSRKAYIGPNVGDVFGRLTVLELLPGGPRLAIPRKLPKARVRCVCGTERIVQRNNLNSGITSSCGCLHQERLVEVGRERAIHGHKRNGVATPEYVSWRAAKQRVTGASKTHRARYAERGITMCREWMDSFQAFLSYVGPKPGPGYSIDRIDNDGNYEPGNVRWATHSEQQRNKGHRAT